MSCCGCSAGGESVKDFILYLERGILVLVLTAYAMGGSNIDICRLNIKKQLVFSWPLQKMFFPVAGWNVGCLKSMINLVLTIQ